MASAFAVDCEPQGRALRLQRRGRRFEPVTAHIARVQVADTFDGRLSLVRRISSFT
jgi:hypothetical protein